MVFSWHNKVPSQAVVANEQSAGEQALVIIFPGPINNIDEIYAIEDELMPAISEAGVGEVDGHDFALDGSSATIYLYGPDADKLLLVATPVLKKFNIARGARCTRRYGPVGDSKSREVVSIL